ncbi:MAG TPA: glycosyl hydrolase family 8 [Polyangia bacterium]|nr:glycosyl hydrolase family 8 [Polyangia bacterium]
MRSLAFACLAAWAAGCSSPGRSTDGSGGASGGSTSAGTGGQTQAGGSGGSRTSGSGGSNTSATGGSNPSGAGGGNGSGTGGGSPSGSGGTVTSGTGGTASGAGGSAGKTGTGGGGGTPAAVSIPGSGHCMAPAGAKVADAQAAYTKWKTDLVTSDGANGGLRVKRPNSSGAEVNSTVSEGIGYAMLLAVYANDQDAFDKFWKYEQQWLDSNGLMNWYINAAGTQVLGTGAASDGDEDMAFALVMADARWGGQGSLSTTYNAAAKKLIDAIWQHEVDHNRNNVLMAGDQFADGSVINISYFAPAYYRVFARVSGNSSWNQTADTTYTILAATLNSQNGNASNGLVPAWSTPAGVPMAPAGTSDPIYHQLDSCRTPFRIGEDYCWNGEPRALTYLQKISSFYSTVTVANMVDGYDLNGSPHPQFVNTGGPRAASFVGGAGVGAMATGTTYTQLRDDAYASVATLSDLAGSTYYQESWTALSLQMMTGLLRDLTAN